jgi:hypothetical protein
MYRPSLTNVSTERRWRALVDPYSVAKNAFLTTINAAGGIDCTCCSMGCGGGDGSCYNWD